MTDITIPDEVVEAAARAFIERRVDAAVWPHFSDERKRGYQEEMRAAIIAALKAWPGMWPDRFDKVDCLVLPLAENPL